MMNIVERVKNILLQPKTEWPVIDPEQTSTQALYTGYIMPLAAIGPIAMLIGLSVVGVQMPFAGTIRMSFPSLLSQVAVSYALGLAGVYVLALIINTLAPTFGGTSNLMQALKVAAYGATAAWVGGDLPAHSLARHCGDPGGTLHAVLTVSRPPCADEIAP